MARFLLISGALGIVILGYYLGNLYKFGELDKLSAVVHKEPTQVTIDPALVSLDNQQQAGWRLYLVVDTTANACTQVLDHYTSVYNRLAGTPKIQAALRLVTLPYNTDNKEHVGKWLAHRSFVTAFLGTEESLEKLTADLGILPLGNRWCKDTQATAALVDKEGYTRALIPFEEPATMAMNLRTIIQTFD